MCLMLLAFFLRDEFLAINPDGVLIGRKNGITFVAQFHDAFANTPEEEVVRDLEKALAEVRQQRA